MRSDRLCLRGIVIFQIFQNVISWELKRTYERSSSDFLKMKFDRNKSRESFNTLQRGSFECP